MVQESQTLMSPYEDAGSQEGTLPGQRQTDQNRARRRVTIGFQLDTKNGQQVFSDKYRWRPLEFSNVMWTCSQNAAG